MKAAICSMGTTLDSPMDPRFGRCASFVVVDTDTMEFTADTNPGAMMRQGAGIQSAQMLSGRGIEAVVAGNFGPNAYQVLSAAGIRIFIGAGGTVRQAVEQLIAGALREVTAPTVAAHYGMGQGMSQGRGTRRGRGRRRIL